MMSSFTPRPLDSKHFQDVSKVSWGTSGLDASSCPPEEFTLVSFPTPGAVRHLITYTGDMGLTF